MNKLEGILKEALEHRKLTVEKLCFEGNGFHTDKCRECAKAYIQLVDYLRCERYEVPDEYKRIYNQLKHKKIMEIS